MKDLEELASCLQFVDLSHSNTSSKSPDMVLVIRPCMFIESAHQETRQRSLALEGVWFRTSPRK
ncbi:hypothetical protein Mapa_006950 [Marchantia paleacea]|nr:hypothetical protein Mapa_006950 [Marchantia paleacea]